MCDPLLDNDDRSTPPLEALTTNRQMRILVYGAGNIGSLYAGLLKQSGQDVSILARGKNLADICERGIQLEDVVTEKQTVAQVSCVTQLEVDDPYDLVLVILPKDHVSEVLPILATNRRTPNVMFLGNNVAGPREMTERLGCDRVLLGFPGASAVSGAQSIRYLVLPAREQPTTIGEIDGTMSPRIKCIANTLRGAGFPVSICSNMGAWLKTHAAEISPTAHALYMAGGDVHRLARTRDALVLMLRAIRESYAVLRVLGIPITPMSHRIFQWIPEPLLLIIMRRKLNEQTMSIKIGHAAGARKEMKTIANEWQALARTTPIPMPAMERLLTYGDPSVEPMADGSSELPLKWGPVWVIGLALAVLAGAIWIF